MHVFQKFLAFIVIGLTCTLSTGFLGIGGETPEKGIAAIVTAIENNDHKAFMERVPRDYWVSVVSEYMSDHENSTYAWLKNLYTTSKKIEKARQVKTSRAIQSYYIMDALLETISDLVASGDFANYCRKYKSATLPFDPNVLKKLSYGEEGSDAQKGLVAAVATMPDGQESVLGMALLDKKWSVVSLAGNKKAAMDRAEAVRKEVNKEKARIAKRKQGAELYAKEMAPQIEKIKELIAEKKWDQIAKLFFEIKSMSPSYYKYVYFGEKYDTPEFWHRVFLGLVANVANEDQMQSFLEKESKNIAKNSNEFIEYFEHFLASMASEVIWKSDNVMLVKSYSMRHLNDFDKIKRKKDEWMNDEIHKYDRTFIYEIFLKKNDNWVVKTVSEAYELPYSSSGSTTGGYFPFYPGGGSLSISIENYSIELAKRFEDFYKKAQVHVANEKKWTKEIEDIFAEIKAGVVNNDTKPFEKHFILSEAMRNKSTVDETAILIAKYSKNNADVQKFLENIKNGTSTFKINKMSVVRVEKLSAVAKNDKGLFYLLERKTEDAPWKIIRAGKLADMEPRPADWDAKVAELVKKYEAQFALEDSVRAVLIALHKAYIAKDPKPFEQYIDLVSFVRDNGNLKQTSVAMANNKKDNNDIKSFLDQVRTGVWSKQWPMYKGLEAYSFASVSPTYAVVKLKDAYLSLHRATEKDAWKIRYYANNIKGLEREEGWEVSVSELSQEILEKRAKEEARAKKALADMQAKTQEVRSGIVKAIKEKDVDAFLTFVDVTAMENHISLEDKPNFKSSLAVQLAPLYMPYKAISSILSSENEPTLPLFNVAVWEKASFSFNGKDESAVIAQLPIEKNTMYALFAKVNDSYKLISPLTENKRYLEKNAAQMAKNWAELVPNYALDSTRKELLQFVDLLSAGKGQELVKQINVENLSYWKNMNDKNDGMKDQAHVTLFSPEKYQDLRDLITQAVNKERAFLFKYSTATAMIPTRKKNDFLMKRAVNKDFVEINPTVLTQAVVRKLSPDMVLLELNANNLLFVKKGKTFTLEGITGELSRSQQEQLKNTYAARNKELEAFKQAALRSVAAQTASNAALDLLQVQAGQYEVFKTEKGTTQLRVTATVKNTSDQTFLPKKFMMYFVDEQGQGWLPWLTQTSSSVEIKPSAEQTFNWEFFPNAKEMYLLQLVQAGKMHFVVRAAEATLGKITYKRFGTMTDPKKLADGTWQLASFAPITPKPQWHAASVENQKALWDGMAKNKKALAVHIGVIQGNGVRVATKEVQPEVVEAQKAQKEEQAPATEQKAVQKAEPKVDTKADTKPEPKPEEKPVQQVEQKAVSSTAGQKTDVAATTQTSTQVAGQATTQTTTQAAGQTPAPESKPESKPKVKPETKPEQKTAEATKPSSPKKAVAPAASGPQPTAPEPKKPGKAFVVPLTSDSMSLHAFAADTKTDTGVRVLAKAKSPLVAVRVESMGGASASWKTKDVKAKALGVLAVTQEGKVLNEKDASFSLDVSQPVLLDLVMQDNGSLANKKVRMRVVFFHKDGSRTYSIIQR